MGNKEGLNSNATTLVSIHEKSKSPHVYVTEIPKNTRMQVKLAICLYYENFFITYKYKVNEMKHHFEPFNSKYMAGCQQPFWSKMAGDNRLSAAVFGPKRLVTTGCQQPSP